MKQQLTAIDCEKKLKKKKGESGWQDKTKQPMEIWQHTHVEVVY